MKFVFAPRAVICSGFNFFVIKKPFGVEVNMKIKIGEIEVMLTEPKTVYDVAAEAGVISRTVIAAKVNGEVVALTKLLEGDAEVELLTFENEEGKHVFRHTASHILAQAVKRLYPATKLTIGPAIDNGFYYDFDSETPFGTDALAAIVAPSNFSILLCINYS